MSPKKMLKPKVNPESSVQVDVVAGEFKQPVSSVENESSVVDRFMDTMDSIGDKIRDGSFQTGHQSKEPSVVDRFMNTMDAVGDKIREGSSHAVQEVKEQSVVNRFMDAMDSIGDKIREKKSHDGPSMPPQGGDVPSQSAPDNAYPGNMPTPSDGRPSRPQHHPGHMPPPPPGHMPFPSDNRPSHPQPGSRKPSQHGDHKPDNRGGEFDDGVDRVQQTPRPNHRPERALPSMGEELIGRMLQNQNSNGDYGDE